MIKVKEYRTIVVTTSSKTNKQEYKAKENNENHNEEVEQHQLTEDANCKWQNVVHFNPNVNDYNGYGDDNDDDNEEKVFT